MSKEKFKKELQGLVDCKWCGETYEKADSWPENGMGGYGFKNPDGTTMKCPYCRGEANDQFFNETSPQ